MCSLLWCGGLQEEPGHGTVADPGWTLWGVRALQRAGGCCSFLCWKSDLREHFPASASPPVLLSSGWNDAQEQNFVPAINRGRACDPRGRRADAAHTASAAMPGFYTQGGLGEGGTSKTVGKKITSRRAAAQAARESLSAALTASDTEVQQLVHP